MDMYKLKWTRLQAEIFRALCIKAGQSFNMRGLARLLGVSPTAISKALDELQKEGLVKVEKSKAMNLVSVEFNRDNQKAIDLKRAENLKLIYQSGLADFLEDDLPGATIILFGSYSKGDDTYDSDIDVAVIGIKERQIDTEKFDKLLEREINFNFYSSFKEIHVNLKNNILNGIVLSGSVEI